MKRNSLFKVIRRFFFFLILVFIITAIAFVPSTYNQFSDNNIETESELYVSENHITEDDFLVSDGSKLMNRCGEEIVLSGVNLGGWLLQEYWMCPVIGSDDVEQWTNLETLNVLESRFGVEKTRALIKTYEDNWITENDIKIISDMGCNVIRIPFWYRNFMTSPDGTWISENPEDNPGFQRLDWIIDAAGRYGVYVILDMHGCPGGQSTDHCSGSSRQCELFENPMYQDAMEKLWLAIANRYKNNPVVAAYDIMNEAQSFNTSVENDPRNLLYDRMIKAIRATGDKHIIAVEAIWNLSVLPEPDLWNWENVIYELHLYGGDYSNADNYFKSLKDYSALHNVPIYIGEYSDMNILQACRKFGISNTSWTYKGTVYLEEPWFMYYNNKVAYADVYNDPYWVIKEKWGQFLLTETFDKNEEVLQHWN